MRIHMIALRYSLLVLVLFFTNGIFATCSQKTLYQSSDHSVQMTTQICTFGNKQLPLITNITFKTPQQNCQVAIDFPIFLSAPGISVNYLNFSFFNIHGQIWPEGTYGEGNAMIYFPTLSGNHCKIPGKDDLTLLRETA